MRMTLNRMTLRTHYSGTYWLCSPWIWCRVTGLSSLMSKEFAAGKLFVSCREFSITKGRW